MAGNSFNVPERRALRIQGTGATVGGAVNTNVVAFTAAAAAWQGSPLTTGIGTTHVAPTAGSGNWINVVNDTDHATTFKFNKKGVYRAQISADNTIADVAAAQLGITLDQALALYTVAAGTVSALSDSVLGWTVIDSLADQGTPCVVSADVYITDTLAGGAQAADAAGVQGVGVLRFIANNNANGLVATAFIVTSIRATIVQIAPDLAG